MLHIADETEKDIIVNKDGDEIVNREHIQRSKVRIDTRKWIAAHMAPKKYGDRVALDHGGQPENPIVKIDVTDKTEEEALKIYNEKMANR